MICSSSSQFEFWLLCGLSDFIQLCSWLVCYTQRLNRGFPHRNNGQLTKVCQWWPCPHCQPFSHPSSDIDTRRRAACDLVRGLCKFFEGPVTAIFSGYVNSMLAEYAKNPGQNWKHKDAAIYLVTSLASKAQTQKVVLAFIFRELLHI